MAAGRHANPRREFSHRPRSGAAYEIETGRGRDQYAGGRKNGCSNGYSQTVRVVGKVERDYRREEVMEEMPPSKKSKFSPITWDREDAGVKVSSNYGASLSACDSVAAVKPRRNGDVHLNTVSVDVNNVCDDVDASDKIQDSESLSKCDAEFRSAESTLTGSPTLSLPSPQKKKMADDVYMNDEEVLAEDEMQVDDAGQANNFHISKSRWASDDDGDTPVSNSSGHNKYKSSKSFSVDTRTSSPECGEFIRDDSEGERSGPASDVNMENDGAVIDEECHDSKGDDADVFSEDKEEENAELPGDVIWDTCRDVFDYERLNKINEGTYGVVYRARNKITGEIVALKKVKLEREREGFPITALREIKFLMSVDHPSIVRGKEIVMGDLDSVFVVMEYMEHDLKGLMEMMKHPFSISEVKCLMLQLLEGIQFLHDNWVIHRDLKSSNILFNNQGELKICDFGMARQYANPLKPYTALVVTLWYRAPELLFGAKQYSEAVDMWSVGCIMAELLSKEPLFQGKTEVDQIDKIIRLLGTPNDTIWPGFSSLPGSKAKFVKQPYNVLRKKFPVTSFTGAPALSDAGFDLLSRMLTYDPIKRITVHEALNHPWFQEVPMAKSKEFMPTYPAQNAQDRTRKQRG
uniref:cyclin-dependent kinase n=2 Tax=Kalanchoe fedtschenkoi TaxID=63787 RepID=A0A7N0RJ30_KALFE